MADELTNALTGLNFTPLDSGFGLGAQGIASALPKLVNPYASPMQNLGVTLGGALVASLLGYQARKEAAQDTLGLMTYANKLQDLQTNQERTDFIKTVDEPMYQSRLATLASALNSRELEGQLKLKESIGLETGKLKALQTFYNTPEGQAARDFELRKIKEDAEARRTPMDRWIEQQNLLQGNRENLENLKTDNKERLQDKRLAATSEQAELDRKARAGDKEADRALKLEIEKSQQEFDRSMIQLKADVGVNAAKEKAQALAALEMQLINENMSPAMAKIEARGRIAKEINQEAISAREESTRRLQQSRTDEIKKQDAYRKQIELENPKVPAAIVAQSAKRITAADTALSIADDIEKFANWTTYRIGTAFTAADEALLRSRIMKLTAEERLALSGTATNESERADINAILNGDISAGPEAKAALLRRFALDSKRMAVSNMKGASQSVGSFVKSVEDSIAAGGATQFTLNESPTSGIEALQRRLQALEAKEQELKKQKGVR